MEETLAKHYGVCHNMILEFKSVIEDFRMLSLGGMKAGIDIFNLAILPMLTYNADIWYEMNDKTIKRLENLQNIFIRCLLSVPISTPTAALSWDFGFLSMEYRVFLKNMNKIFPQKSLLILNLRMVPW